MKGGFSRELSLSENSDDSISFYGYDLDLIISKYIGAFR